jgi:predicted secreted hydrolase
MKFGHFAVTDLSNRQFIYHQKLSRGAFGEAGFQADRTTGEKIAWLEDWKLSLDAAGQFVIAGSSPEARVELTLAPKKPWVIHGKDGISQKAAEEGRASHYYSGTRLASEGQIVIKGQTFQVRGESWFDHEWATNQLTPEQVGWDWFSIQLEDGTELMLYQMRRRNGSADPTSSGTFVAREGSPQHLTIQDYTLTPTDYWTSKETGARYPIAWEASVPSLSLTLQVKAAMPQQELVLKPIAYWEGMIRVSGERAGKQVRGHGYMELTGYAGPLVGLSAPAP